MLEGENISLRALEPEDLDLFYKWENDSSVWKISQTYKPFSKFLLKRYLENAHQDIFTVKQLRLMIEKDGVAIGTIDLFDYEPMHARAGLGIWIVQDSNRRQGYAKEALRLTIEYAFFKLQLNQLYCNISANNQASINLFSALDFVLIGVKKKWNKSPNGWQDELMFQLLCE